MQLRRMCAWVDCLCPQCGHFVQCCVLALVPSVGALVVCPSLPMLEAYRLPVLALLN